ncbi:MAG: hydrogenase [Kiritimatiellae bacterium]|nr:hydrogenase [Kiritimatiellia bacterium]MDD5523350.1 hydrogenase [Kiritimatiellia bacterium]
MFGVVKTRLLQGHRTMKYPDGPAPELPEKFIGKPVIDCSKCQADCKRTCIDVCPTGAIAVMQSEKGGISLDMGKCLFCGVCRDKCPSGTICFGRKHQLAATKRDDLVVKNGDESLASALNKKAQKLFGRSLKLRQVSAGGCNACESDTNVLNTVGWDLGRFGIQFVASPRHADGLLVTGPVSENMKEALLKTYEAVASPKIVIAVGACAISGGPYIGHPETCSGVTKVVPVDLFIPGCPPHPLTILDGLLRFVGRL